MQSIKQLITDKQGKLLGVAYNNNFIFTKNTISNRKVNQCSQQKREKKRKKKENIKTMAIF